MYLGENGGPTVDEVPAFLPEDQERIPPNEPISGSGADDGGGASVSVNANPILDAIGRIFRGVTVVPNFPNQGRPGTSGCAPNQCPVLNQMGLAVCVPCTTPQYGGWVVPGAPFTSQPYLLPLLIVGAVVLLATSGKGRR